MPAYSPPRRYRSDNIARVLDRKHVEGLLRALTPLRRKSGPWIDRDPHEHEAWWCAVLSDPRTQRTRRDHIPADHPDASLRLDRCVSPLLTVRCAHCKAMAVYTVDDLRSTYGADQNIMTLPAALLPCASKRDRRDGACELRAEPGGYAADVRTVKGAIRL